MYGKKFPTKDQRAIELWCFANDPPLGLGRAQHLRNAIDLTWNAYQPDTFIWNEWSERMMRAFAEQRWVTVTGPAASWKTTCASMYALCAFYSDPSNTVVICTSTTLDGLRRRIWKEVSKFHRLRTLFGHMVQSRNCIQLRKGHDNAGIFGLATDKGEIEKAIGKIIGFHAPRVIVVVDEMPYTPEAIVEACVNLETGARFFQFIGLGNADDQLDPHGRMSEPKGGWDAISVETEEWPTKRGLCIHLDGLKSPNITDRPKVYPGLLSQQDIETTTEVYGVDSPQFWQMRRGFWAPEGIQKTVLSMPMIVRTNAMAECSFDVDSVNVASLDPSFEGGDRCVLRFGRVGRVHSKNTLLLGEHVYIKTRVSLDDPVHYQIARRVKEECTQRGVDPYYFGMDSTGEGGGLASIIQREWSREILCVEFGGRPPRIPVSPVNSKKCDDEYDRQVTYLWFAFRLLLLNDQIKGLDYETAAEFCRRWWTMKGPYVSLETKEKMKDRTRKSPDLADNAVIMAQVAHVRCGMSPNEFGEWEQDRGDTPWKRFLSRRNQPSDYAAPVFD
jgi:hypothetical protein